MDLKGLTPNSFREGESSMYAQYLKHSPPGTTSRMNNTVINKNKKKNTKSGDGALFVSGKDLIMISEEDDENDDDLRASRKKTDAVQSMPDRKSVFLLDEDDTFNFKE